MNKKDYITITQKNKENIFTLYIPEKKNEC